MSTTPAERLPFSIATALTPTPRPGRFSGDLHPEWTITGRPNGGYILAMLGRAAASMSIHPHPVAASATYLRPPDPGPVSIEAQLLREGQTTSQVRTRMLQGGESCVEAMITVSRLTPGTAPTWQRRHPEATPTPLEKCVRLVPSSKGGTRVAMHDQVDIRLEPRSAGFLTGAPTGKGELWGWLALHDEEFDPFSLLFAVDAYPPATFDIVVTRWVPTLELTAYTRALPAPGPLRVLQRAQLIDAGRVDELCWVWDSTGRLVAQGNQLAGIRLG